MTDQRIKELVKELDAVYANLTSVQKRCTELVEENRKLRTMLRLKPSEEERQRKGANLRDLRLDAGLTQYELAAMLGTGQSSVAHAESGRSAYGERYIQRVIDACNKYKESKK